MLSHQYPNGCLVALQAECESVPATPYLARIQEVYDQLPIKAHGDSARGAVNVSNATESLPDNLTSGLPAEVVGVAPQGNDAESGASDGEPLFPGAFCAGLQLSVCLRATGPRCMQTCFIGSWGISYPLA
jgi:hypothetical protein